MAILKRIPAWVLMAIGLIAALTGSYWSSFAVSLKLADQDTLEAIAITSILVGMAFIVIGFERMRSR